jgi:small subunit ribosomal protein S8
MPSSNFKLAIAKILKKEGYIEDVIQYKKGFKVTLEIVLKKNDSQYAISEIQRVSKPGQRVYVRKNKMPKILNGYGLAIISTSMGLMTNNDAKEKGLGGEIVFKVW